MTTHTDGDDSALRGNSGQRGDGRPAVIGRRPLIPLGPAELQKEFPGLDLVIYNEHLKLVVASELLHGRGRNTAGRTSNRDGGRSLHETVNPRPGFPNLGVRRWMSDNRIRRGLVDA